MKPPRKTVNKEILTQARHEPGKISETLSPPANQNKKISLDNNQLATIDLFKQREE